jgi:hypothetical protein
LVFFRLHVAREKEALLTQSNLTRLLCNRDHGETNFTHPDVHEAVHVLTRSFAKRGPQVVGSSVRVLVCLQVVGNTLQEDLLAEVGAQHANNGASLEIANVVKDLVDLETIVHGNLDGMRCS